MEIKAFIPDLLVTAFNAGKAIMEVYDHAIEITYKDDRSPLTAADRASHKVIETALSGGSFGQFPLLSEEGKSIPYDTRKEWVDYWLIDPLDGTKEFIKRNGEFTVNIALIRGQRPVLGIIYIPVTDTFYYAVEGLGSFKVSGAEIAKMALVGGSSRENILNDLLGKSSRNRVSHPSDPYSKITVIGSKSHATEEQTKLIEKIGRKIGSVNVLSAGSSLKFCYVAEGQADIYPRFGPTMEWDTAAGQSIVEQAGGSVIAVDTKKSLQYNKTNLLNPWFIVRSGQTEFLQDVMGD